jgi:hypothetical protein
MQEFVPFFPPGGPFYLHFVNYPKFISGAPIGVMDADQIAYFRKISVSVVDAGAHVFASLY